MNWPTSQDYNEAVQNASSFGDPGLKRGAVTVNALGLPVPRSGNFADVYQFKGGDGKMWAVKCFTRKVTGLQERYAKIDEHLARIKLPFTVGFTYLESGIRVRGQWFPLLKMEWVEGFTLNEFVRDNADKPKYLHALMQMWAKLTARLRDGDLAHADLQHGNVLLVQGDAPNKLGLKLIDYDGMWVPALAGKHSGEIGHPNFQHPLRLKNRLYNADVDRFPHLVVACALRATTIGGRTLLDKFDNGDNLLFKEADLRDPRSAPVFAELWNLGDDVLCALLGTMALSSREPLSDTPWLDHLLLVDGGPRLTADQEKKAIEILNVSPHFTAAKAAPAVEALMQAEFGDFNFADDATDERPVAETMKGPKSSWLPYYVGGGTVAACLIGSMIALMGGGNDNVQPPQEVVKSNAKDGKPNHASYSKKPPPSAGKGTEATQDRRNVGSDDTSVIGDASVRPLGADGKPLNLDFETGTLKDWTAEGEAFNGQPIKGDNVAARRPDMNSEHQGEYWIGTFEMFGDQPQGTLTSASFKVTQPWASFLVGGGSFPETCVELVCKDDGKVFRSASGANLENMHRVTVDLKEVVGKQIFIRLVDKSSGGWGHINFDDFRFHKKRPAVVGTRWVHSRGSFDFAKVDDWVEFFDGRQTFSFKELERGPDYALLFDAGRNCRVWLQNDRSLVQFGERPIAGLYRGEWTK
jgi:hypothetical protein